MTTALFPHMKSELRGHRFATRKELIDTVHYFLYRKLSEEYFKGVFDSWIMRLRSVLLTMVYTSRNYKIRITASGRRRDVDVKFAPLEDRCYVSKACF